MLKEQAKIITRAHKLLDIALTAAAFVGAYFIKKYMLPRPVAGLTTAPNYYIVLLLVVIIWYLVFDAFGLYQSYRRKRFSQVLFGMLKAVAAGMLILLVLLYALKINDVSRLMLAIFFILDIVLLALSKGLVYRLLVRFRRQGYNFRNVLIVGSRERARDVIRAIGDRLGAGFRVIGCLDVYPEFVDRIVESGCRVIGTVENLQEILEREAVDELIFAMPLKKIPEAGKYIVLAEDMGVAVRIIPDWQLHHLMYRPGKARIGFEDFVGIPSMSLQTTPPARGALLLKAALDYGAAAGMLIVSLPLFGVIALAIKIASPGGPVFYKQERCGLNGRRFQFYKFRTMVPEAERLRHGLDGRNEADGPVFKIRNDPRIIPWLGHFLRRTSLDELPQLINVLCGQMSLVGPRPPIPAEVERYERWQHRRLSMKPGLTCIWQVVPGRNDVTFAEWMKMDLAYIDNWSLGLDFKILVRTALVVLFGQGR